MKLGLDLYKVEEIKQRYNGNLNMCKSSVYDAWLRLSADPSWRDVVQALEQMDENNLATKIKQRYSMYFPESKFHGHEGVVKCCFPNLTYMYRL